MGLFARQTCAFFEIHKARYLDAIWVSDVVQYNPQGCFIKFYGLGCSGGLCVLLGASDHPHHAGRRVHGLQTCLTSSQTCTMHSKQRMNGLLWRKDDRIIWQFGSHTGTWLVLCAWRRQSWFLPHSLQARHFLHILCTQMDSHFKKEQIDTLFVYVGLLQAGFWGGWVVQRGSHPFFEGCSTTFFFTLLRAYTIFFSGASWWALLNV